MFSIKKFFTVKFIASILAHPQFLMPQRNVGFRLNAI